MVVFTNERYTAICLAAAIPAILYFLGAAIAVFAQGEVGDVELLPEDQIPKTRDVLKDGYLYLIIIFALIWALMIAQYSPALSGLIGCVSVPVVRSQNLFPRRRNDTIWIWRPKVIWRRETFSLNETCVWWHIL